MDFRKFLTPKIFLPIILLIALFLRVWQIDRVPVSLFGDELDLGYHAYSILKTGRDYSGNFLPIHFHSLAEWRTPLYLYSAVPTVAIFGITPLGVRLPAVIFGVLGIWALYLLVKELFKNEKMALISAVVLALSPWHLQYSRAGFEVTQLLFFLIIGLYLFYKGLNESKWMWLSAVCFALTPWVYSTAKLFIPLLVGFLVLLYRKELIKLPKKNLVFSALAFMIVGLPITISTISGGGAERFNYLSVFSDPQLEQKIGEARDVDARFVPASVNKLIHNKFTFWGSEIYANLFKSLSTDFLFNEGDTNLRHSIPGIGQFYQVEAISLVIGIVLFFAYFKDKRIKVLVIFWTLAGIFPSAITRDGGMHATRLILILPPLVILISYALSQFKKVPLILYGAIYLVSILFFMYHYLVSSPVLTQKWWHAGWGEAIASMKTEESRFSKIVITMKDEPAWIFFAGHYMYDPAKWQSEFPIGNDVELSGFGKVSHTGKYYFGSPQGELYDWGKVIDKDTLYIASQKEVKLDLIKEPERTPNDLKLIKAVAYPSGDPAFYLFTKK